MRIRSVKILVLHALLNVISREVLDCMVEEKKLLPQEGYCNIHLFDIVYFHILLLCMVYLFSHVPINKLCSLIGLGVGSFSFITY